MAATSRLCRPPVAARQRALKMSSSRSNVQLDELLRPLLLHPSRSRLLRSSSLSTYHTESVLFRYSCQPSYSHHTHSSLSIYDTPPNSSATPFSIVLSASCT